jgi:dolichol-phosphate mannosyltransferase
VAENTELLPEPTIPELSVIIPVYNRAEALAVTLDEAPAALDEICGEWELIVINDGSSDGTQEVLQERAAREQRFRVLAQPDHLGHPTAMRRGFDAARFLVVATTDAEGWFDLRELAVLYPKLHDVHLVAGYRTDRDPRRPGMASRLYKALVRIMLGLEVRDVNCSVKLYRRSLLHMIELGTDHVVFDAEIFVRTRQAGLEWAEVGVSSDPDRAQPSAVSVGDVFVAFRELWALRRSL